MYLWAAASHVILPAPGRTPVGFPEAHGSRTAFQQDISNRVLATRVHQTVSSATLPFKFPLLHLQGAQCVSGNDYRCHH